jgi:hypothetical protein
MSTAVVSSRYGSDVKEVREFVKELFNELLPKLKETQAGQPRTIFFPNGIELIAVKVKAGSSVEFSFAVAGEKAPKIEHLSPATNGQQVVLNDTPVEVTGTRREKQSPTKSQLPAGRL